MQWKKMMMMMMQMMIRNQAWCFHDRCMSVRIQLRGEFRLIRAAAEWGKNERLMLVE